MIKTTSLLASGALLAALSLTGCAADGTDTLGGRSGSGSSSEGASGSETGSAYNHNNDPGSPPGDVPFQAAEPAQKAAEVAASGSPEVAARLHSCGKITVASLGRVLQTRGIGGQAQQIFGQGPTSAALGGPNYGGRVPEASFASTSALTKMFDIFVIGADSVTNANWAPEACPGTKLLEGGKFTKDALTCLMGKPARQEHLDIANDALAKAKTPEEGAKIAVAAIMSAAHTCD